MSTPLHVLSSPLLSLGSPHDGPGLPPHGPATPHDGPATPRDGLAGLHHRLSALLDRQAGVVGRGQALAAGLGPREIDRLLARRLWDPVHPRVYLAAGRPLTDEARVRAAALWAGDGAVVVGAAAVWWHGLWSDGPGVGAPATVGVALPRRCPAGRPGVTARRQHLPAAEVVTVRGLAVPVRPLALLDAAVEAGSGGPALLRRALDGDVGLTERQLRAVAASSAGTATAARLIEAAVAPAGTATAARLIAAVAPDGTVPPRPAHRDVGPTTPRAGMTGISESLQ